MSTATKEFSDQILWTNPAPISKARMAIPEKIASFLKVTQTNHNGRHSTGKSGNTIVAESVAILPDSSALGYKDREALLTGLRTLHDLPDIRQAIIKLMDEYSSSSTI